MEHVAILLAGGSGDRMGASIRDKILIQIGGQSVFEHVLDAFIQSETQDALVVVSRDDLQRKELKSIVRKKRISLPVFYTLGGSARQESVLNGLEILPSECKYVTIHDCARPAVHLTALKAVRSAVTEMDCAVSLAHRVTDTIRQFEQLPLEQPAKGQLLPREHLWAMETPQAFPRALIEEAHQSLQATVTDDLAVVEEMGLPVLLVESVFQNPKLTRPADLPLLEKLLSRNTMNNSSRPPFRVGFGYDIHRLKEGLPLILGGIAISSDVGLVGHSDADVLSHAIADAILGGCGLPDIGHYFPNTDAGIKGISSQEILKKACKEADRLGYRLLNVDASLIAEKPKISPYLERMKRQLSKTLGLQETEIGIKATTQEQIGALGKAAGIAAHAVATLAG
ncbi:2-C-methyl-D-erythritol 2,4-cyclodiphosphate synthase [Puniceicoccales bacterium CK1056]|uniref:2-C-methyl-D-erythritol 2,4-cyclodiphosphate synthase n=1 Tax=Oceanipulchritudo coccoides TaxID=2706888 RepID=A0A6B2LZ04_9BACT|nr:2-C-methyl-D-erythritol 2,4-cyclodiphosphate synthase [Oceanipulchritudo coccoides]NDV61392.1 2-C-methyl-D-erythritol 2,4-cyclodiphosphate synthase [Oceanipulchritudo coccoides]